MITTTPPPTAAPIPHVGNPFDSFVLESLVDSLLSTNGFLIGLLDGGLLSSSSLVVCSMSFGSGTVLITSGSSGLVVAVSHHVRSVFKLAWIELLVVAVYRLWSPCAHSLHKSSAPRLGS